MDSRILAVAVGLGTIYLFYSLAVTHVNEAIAGLLSSRAKFLAKGIKEKLLGVDLGQRLLEHPLIQSFGFTKKNLPSYIPGPAFARALVEIVGKADAGADAAAKWADAIDAQKLPDELKKRLATVIKHDSVAMHEAEVKIAQWYDGTMDRLSGAYRRRSQWWAFGIGLALVGLTNTDTLALATRLWEDPVERQAEIALAQKYVDQCHKNDATGKVECTARAASEIPMRWTLPQLRQAVSSPLDFVLKLIGLLLSAVAVSLGAPFWFDLLQKIAPGFRMSGQPPKRAEGPLPFAPPAPSPTMAPPHPPMAQPIVMPPPAHAASSAPSAINDAEKTTVVAPKPQGGAGGV